MTLAVLCGLPRSGKTTMAKLHLQDMVRVSPDDIRIALHGEVFIARAENHVWAMAETMVRAFLIGNQNVVVDATNITVASRERWKKIADEFNATFEINWVNTPFSICQQRNQGVGAVPNSVLENMYQQFQVPTMKEGSVLVFDYDPYL